MFRQVWCFGTVFNRRLSIWSPLADAFNARPRQKFNLRRNDTGLFDVPQLTSHEGFYRLVDECTSKTESLINEALSNTRQRKMVEILDDMSNYLCQVADLSEFIRITHPEAKYCQAAESACRAVGRNVEKLNTNDKLYKALQNSISTSDIKPTSVIDKYVSELFLFDFEQSGIHLSENERSRVVNLNSIILILGQQFVSGTSQPRKVKKELLPSSIRDVFVMDGDTVIVSGLYTDSSNPVVREIAYRTFLYPDPHQDTLLTELLKSRHELAIVCGFSTYAKRALRGATLDDPKKVLVFLQKLTEGIWDKAKSDYHLMGRMKGQENPGNGPLGAWDVPYFIQRAKKNWFRVSSEEYSPYFSLGACMEGVNLLYQSLFGIQLYNTEVDSGECWYPDVYKLSVVHETEGLLGYIYCDFYERSGKPNQDCHFTVRGGKNLPDGTYQIPIAVLTLNLPVPKWSNPSLLTPSMVDNLFHEMGHAMHSMLARTQYQHINGTRCATDFAEVPSVLMEYFAADPRVLNTFAKHYQTKKPMPADMLRRLCASKHVFTASETQLQTFYSAMDQVYHGEHPLQGSTTEVLARTQNSYYGLPYVPDTAWHLRFSHFVGYGAKYYSYLVSRAVAFSIWQKYFENNPFSRENGEKYRRECLSHGGGKHPRNMIADFLQVQPDPEVLATFLVKEIEYHQEQIDSVMNRLG